MKYTVRNSLVFLLILVLLTFFNGLRYPVVAEHIHNKECGFAAAQDEISCDQNCVDLDGDGVIDHVENCSYQPAVEEQKCQYEVANSNDQDMNTNTSPANLESDNLRNVNSETFMSFSTFKYYVDNASSTGNTVDLDGKTVLLRRNDYLQINSMNRGANVTIKNGKLLKADDCTDATFATVQWAHNSLTFENVIFDGNNAPFLTGNAMVLWYSGYLSLKNCEFKNINAGINDDRKGGCGMIMAMGEVGPNSDAKLTLDNVTILDCTTATSYVYIQSDIPTSINNLRINGKYDPSITENQCHGVMMETQWETDLNITNSSISGCNYGIYMVGGSLDSQNNTITNNEIGIVASDYTKLNTASYHYSLNNDTITNNGIGITYKNRADVSNSLSLNGNVKIVDNKNANLQLLIPEGNPINVKTLTSGASIGIGVSYDMPDSDVVLAKKDNSIGENMQDDLSYFSSDHVGYKLNVKNDSIVFQRDINYAEVTFETYGGGSISPEIVEKNTTINEPASPTKVGYEFVGWFSDNQYKKEWDFNKDIVSEDTTLYAKYKLESYLIEYELNDGVNDKQNPTSYNIEDETIILKEPSKTGYTFVGWTYWGQSTPKKEVSIPTGSTKNKLYTANWEINTYQVSFENVGEGVIPTQTLDYNTLVQEPTNPIKTDFIFDGWYTDENDGIRWDFSKDTIQNDMKLYARWIKASDQNYIVGVNANEIYIIGDDVSFEAVGWGLDNENPQINDVRYVPYSWSINPNGIWDSAPYKADFVIEKPGEYELKVVFHKEVYTQNQWVYTGENDIKTSKVIIKDKVDKEDNENIDNEDKDKENETHIEEGKGKEEKENNKIGVDTKDHSEIVKYIGLLGISIFLIIFAKRRKEA